ncbi:MAG TPA: VanW family protein [bacterium]|nr:VanW family protein [bacterium]
MKRALAGLIILLVGVSAGAITAFARDAAVHAGRIFPGISIETLPVGGLTPAEAEYAVGRLAEARLGRPLVVHLATEEVVFTHAELGLRVGTEGAVQRAFELGRLGPWWQRARTRLRIARGGASVPLRIELDRRALRRLIMRLSEEISPVPQEAEVSVSRGEVVMVRPGRPGRTLDVEATVRQIAAAIAAGATDTDAVVAVTDPVFTTAKAQALRTPLARAATTMVNNPDRIHNIELAASFVRGRLLAPGEIFSYNAAVGPRTIERGFREAPVLIDDELVAGDGGGICQVSSTLFNVALLADFDILSRTNHSRPVAYLPLGRDATVVYNWLDFRFRNTSGHHVLLWAEVRGRRLIITAYGTATEAKAVEILVTDHEEIAPPEGTVTKEDPELDEGTVVARDAQPGYRVTTWRVVTLDGIEVRRDFIGTSVYRPVPRTIKIGIRKTPKLSEGH